MVILMYFFLYPCSFGRDVYKETLSNLVYLLFITNKIHTINISAHVEKCHFFLDIVYGDRTYIVQRSWILMRTYKAI